MSTEPAAELPAEADIAMAHEPRLTQALRALITSSRVAALGTLGENGSPFVSMVPFAVDHSTSTLVIHVSGLAAHTRNMSQNAQVSLLIAQPEVVGEPVHALPRVTLEAVAMVLELGTDAWTSARAAYLVRFPDAEPMTQLGDFKFMGIAVTGARQVAGFGAARSLDAADIASVLRHQTGAVSGED